MFRSRAVLELENLALRHQIGVLQRSARKRFNLTPADRLLWVWLSRIWSDWRSALAIIKPETVVAWHRTGFRRFWTWKARRGQPARPVIAREVRDLIRQMCRENPTWGAPRIHGELLKLGIDIGETSVSKYMGRGRRPPRRPGAPFWAITVRSWPPSTSSPCPPSKHNEVATGIFKSGQRMLKLVNNLLDFTRTQLGSALPIKVKKTDIVNICLGAVEELRKNHPERSIEFSAKGNREGLWDEARIAQVFSNLIGNALQHGAQTEPVTVQLDSNSDEIIARIRNKGTPIDREKMQSIFEPLVRFTEEDSIGHANETSLGIGLYITREIVQPHKGDILVDSSHGEGTTFTVRLPRAPLLGDD